MHATTVAIDLAKEVFELAFADPAGHILERKRLTRRAFSRAMENRAPLTVVMEACGSAHYWGRRFQAQGDRKSTRLNSSHVKISYAVFCLKKKKKWGTP